MDAADGERGHQSGLRARISRPATTVGCVKHPFLGMQAAPPRVAEISPAFSWGTQFLTSMNWPNRAYIAFARPNERARWLRDPDPHQIALWNGRKVWEHQGD